MSSTATPSTPMTTAPPSGMPSASQRLAALAMLAAASFFLGGAMVSGKVAVQDLPPMTVAAARFGIAAILLIVLRTAWPALDRGSQRPRLRDVPILVALGLTASAGYNLLFLTGLQYAPASDAAMIIPGLAPIVSTAGAALLLRDRATRSGLIGLAIAAVGVLLVVGPSGELFGERLNGDLLFIGCAVLWGSYYVLSRIAARRFSPVSITLYGVSIAAIALVPGAIAEGGLGRLASAGPSAWMAVGHLAALATVAAFVLLNEGLRRIGVSKSAAFALMIPVFGVAQAMVVLREPLHASALIGAPIVLIGIYLVQGGRLPSISRRTPTRTARRLPIPA